MAKVGAQRAGELTGKSKSTILRFIRKYRKSNPNQREILLVQKGLTREYKITKSLIEKYFKDVQKHTTSQEKRTAKDQSTDQTTGQRQSTGQLEALYKMLLEEREKRILELKQFNSRLAEENTELRSFNRQFSGYFANLSKTLQLGEGKTPVKFEAKKTVNKTPAKKVRQSPVKEKRTQKKAQDERILGRKSPVKKRKPPVKRKSFWQRFFS